MVEPIWCSSTITTSQKVKHFPLHQGHSAIHSRKGALIYRTLLSQKNRKTKYVLPGYIRIFQMQWPLMQTTWLDLKQGRSCFSLLSQSHVTTLCLRLLMRSTLNLHELKLTWSATRDIKNWPKNLFRKLVMTLWKKQWVKSLSIIAKRNNKDEKQLVKVLSSPGCLIFQEKNVPSQTLNMQKLTVWSPVRLMNWHSSMSCWRGNLKRNWALNARMSSR